MATVESTSSESIESVLSERYFLDLMRDLADENKVEKMAICLGVPPPILAMLKRNFSNDTPLLATKVLMAWRDNLTCETVAEAAEELAAALAMVDLARLSTLVQKLNGSRSTTPLAQVHSTLAYSECSTEPTGTVVEHPPPDNHPISPQTQEPPLMKRRCTRAMCGWALCYATLGLVVMATLGAIPSLKYTPKTRNTVSPPSVRANDTVELSFSLPTAWLQTLSLSIDRDCTAVAFTHRGRCSDLYPAARICYNQSEFSGHRVNYLLPGSHLNFSVGPDYQCQTDIWVTWNPGLLYERNFSRFSCDSPPPQTKCLRPLLERSLPTYLVFPVTKAAYYAIWKSPLPDPPCTLSLQRHICSYNVSRLGETASAVTETPIQSDPVSVDILYRPYSFSEVCTIVHVQQDGHHCQGFDGGRLGVKTGRRQDVVLFPALLAGLTVVVVVAVAVFQVVGVVRRRRAAGPRYQRLPSAQV